MEIAGQCMQLCQQIPDLFCARMGKHGAAIQFGDMAIKFFGHAAVQMHPYELGMSDRRIFVRLAAVEEPDFPFVCDHRPSAARHGQPSANDIRTCIHKPKAASGRRLTRSCCAIYRPSTTFAYEYRF